MIMKVNCIGQSMTIVYPSHTQLNVWQGIETSAQHIWFNSNFDSQKGKKKKNNYDIVLVLVLIENVFSFLSNLNAYDKKPNQLKLILEIARQVV